MSRRTNPNIWLIMPIFLLGQVSNLCGQIAPEYYVANDGDDNNPGTQALPFKTIGRAFYKIIPRRGQLPSGGITVWIRDGIYRETVRPRRSGTADAPIRFVAYPGEEPMVSGADVLDVPWTLHSGKIYKAPTTVEFEQLFVDGQMMQEARWPNTSTRDLIRARHATCDNGTNDAVLVDDALPQGDWNGAYVHIRPWPGWSYQTKRITNYKPSKSLEFSETDWLDYSRETRTEDRYWLFGAMVGLDRATEWFLDPKTHVLYLWCPGDPDPAHHTIEIKRREYAFDLSGYQHIRVEGLRVFAAGIAMEDSMYCSVIGCHLMYPLHRRIVPPSVNWDSPFWKSNYMSGSYNEWKDTAIACSAGPGIDDTGDHNKVINCIIHDWAYAGLGAGAIQASAGAHYSEYSYNTIYEGGGLGINMYVASYLRVEHNHIYNVASLVRESAFIGAGWTDPGGTIIAYNRLHDNLDKEDGNGIALDTRTRDYLIHHNLVWNVKIPGIKLNSPALDNEVYNNTVFNCDKSFGCCCGTDLDQRGTRVINNIANAPMKFATGAKAPEQHHNGYYSIDANGWPTPGSDAIDAGVVIPGITDGYVGSAPDIGCFEVGTEGWQAGADWEETPFTRISNIEGFETGDFFEFEWRHLGNPGWFVSFTDGNSGMHSARSAMIANDEATTLQLTLDCVSGHISFYRKVSSEKDCDYLKFYIDGVKQAEWSGTEGWAEVSFPVTAGTRTFEWTYSKDGSDSSGDDTAWIDDIVFPVDSGPEPSLPPTPPPPPVTDPLSEALDTALSFTTGGSADWFAQTTTTRYDGDAAQSGDISHSQDSWMQTTVSGTGTIKFYWKVSSEEDFDFLEFYIDGSLQEKISGSEDDWERQTYTISTPGSHTLKWRYMKDGSGNVGSDCGWVDKVEWVTN